MRIIMLGDGGHSKVIQSMISRLPDYRMIAILDDKYESIFTDAYILYGPIETLKTIIDEECRLVLAIGDNQTRKQIAEALGLPLKQYATIIDPSAVISKSCLIGHGTVIMPNTVMNANAAVGNHCIINSGAVVEHDSAVAHFSHISPNATLTGNVTIGEGVQVGAGATIIPGVEIGKWSIVGAGSTLIRPLPSYCKAVGSPAKIIEESMKRRIEIV